MATPGADMLGVVVSSLTGPVVRPYREADLEAVYEICVLTGDESGEAYPRLLPDIYAGPYLYLEPALAFVLDAGKGPVGYVLGTSNTARFVRAYREKWAALLASRYPVPPSGGSSRDDELLEVFHDPERMLVPGLDDYPAHLHIDILPSHQGRGGGRRLIESFCGSAALAGATGVHLAVGETNIRAQGFYERVGFERLDVESPGTLFYGRRTRA